MAIVIVAFALWVADLSFTAQSQKGASKHGFGDRPAQGQPPSGERVDLEVVVNASPRH